MTQTFAHCTAHSVAQRSPEWHALRANRLTCSNLHPVLTGSIRQRNTLLRKIQLSEPIAVLGNVPALEWGKYHEPQALANYCLLFSEPVTEVGFLTSNVIPRFGGSPDGLILGNGTILGGVEIKCPYNSSVHLSYVRSGCPAKYMSQITGYLILTGAAFWDFVSYDPRSTPDIFRQRISLSQSLYADSVQAIRTFCHHIADNTLFDEAPSASSVLRSSLVNHILSGETS